MADIWINVDAVVTVPINVLPFVDDTDFKTIENAISSSSVRTYWNFIPTSGSQSQTYVEMGTETNYKWINVGNGLYATTIPATGGSYINNDTEGFGWFTGSGTGILPWRSPMIGFRAAILNDNLIDNANALATGSGLATIPTTDYTNLISTRMSGSYLGSLSSASSVDQIYTSMISASSLGTVEEVWTSTIRTLTSASGLDLASASSVAAIPTTDYTSLISTRMSGSYLGSLASASSVDNITGTSASTIWSYADRTLTTGSIIFQSIFEGNMTVEEGLRVFLAALSGSSSGGGTETIKFKDPSGTVDRITATVDANGNRTSVTLNTD